MIGSIKTERHPKRCREGVNRVYEETINISTEVFSGMLRVHCLV